MFVVDKNANKISRINERSFSELGFREREHLQEWLENEPEVFGEEILIIQKEFDGFDNTRERLDLLGIDKQGSLVIIENKLDDSGRDVTWQALKYASYCSSLSKLQVRDIYQEYLDKKNANEESEANISEFLNGEDFGEIQLNQSQRIILVAANYRKEVTSTVLWLLTKYKLNIQCFKTTPYSFNNQILLNIEQIIPVKEVEEFTIKMAEKAQEEQDTQNELKTRHKLRLEFWKKLLEKYNQTNSNLFQNISPSKDAWISAGSGISGVGFQFVVSKRYARTELYVSKGIKEENKFIFDELHKLKDDITAKSTQLIWERLDTKKASRIKNELTNVSLYEKEDWDEMINFVIESMIQMEEAFKTPLKTINRALKKKFNA
jgi:hypothetical protein